MIQPSSFINKSMYLFIQNHFHEAEKMSKFAYNETNKFDPK